MVWQFWMEQLSVEETSRGWLHKERNWCHPILVYLVYPTRWRMPFFPFKKKPLNSFSMNVLLLEKEGGHSAHHHPTQKFSYLCLNMDGCQAGTLEARFLSCCECSAGGKPLEALQSWRTNTFLFRYLSAFPNFWCSLVTFFRLPDLGFPLRHFIQGSSQFPAPQS